MRESLSDTPSAKRPPRFTATLVDEEIISWNAYDEAAEATALRHYDELAFSRLCHRRGVGSRPDGDYSLPMGRGKKPATLLREIALSSGDGRLRLVPPTRPSLPSLGLRVTVSDLGDGYPAFSEGEAPVFRLRDDEQVVLVYGQEGRTLLGNLGQGATSGALLARLMREGHTLKGEVANQGQPLELLVEVY